MVLRPIVSDSEAQKKRPAILNRENKATKAAPTNAAVGNPPKTSERYWFSLLTRSSAGELVPTVAYTKLKEARASGFLPD